MTEYTMLVRFTRNLEDDSDVLAEQGHNPPTAKDFVRQLQEGYDLAGIAGEFKVVSVTIREQTLKVED